MNVNNLEIYVGLYMPWLPLSICPVALNALWTCWKLRWHHLINVGKQSIESNVGQRHRWCSLKLLFRYQLIDSINKHFKDLAYICYDKCFSWRNLCLVLKKNNNTTLVYLLSNCRQVLTRFVFDDFSICY